MVQRYEQKRGGKKKEKRGGEIRIGRIHRRKVATAHSAMRL